MAEQRDVLALREHGDACSGMRVADRPQEWGDEEDVSDRAEANRQNVRRAGSVWHAEKVQRER
jgi:hypothetical protein